MKERGRGPAALRALFSPGRIRAAGWPLFLVGAYGAVGASHAGRSRAAVDAFVGAVAVDMLPGGCLETAVSIRAGAAVDAAFFVVVMLVEARDAFWAAGTVCC
jgi:hypothetical protein